MRSPPGAALALLSALSTIAGCREPATGVVLAVSSELSSPEVDALEIRVDGVQSFSQRYPLPASASLPGTVTFTPHSDESSPRTYEVTLRRGAEVIVKRRAVMPFQHGSVKVLRLPLEVACVGVACDDPSSTCIRGGCASAVVDPAALADAPADPAVPAAEAGCFDEASCFAGAPRLALGACSFPVSGDGGKLNVALVGANGAPKALAASGSYAVASGVVTLLPGVCAAAAKLGLGVELSYRCAPRRPDQPLCAPPPGAGAAGSAGQAGAAGAPGGGGVSGTSGQGGAGAGGSGAGGVAGAAGLGGAGAMSGGSGAGGAMSGGSGGTGAMGGSGGAGAMGGSAGQAGASGSGPPALACGDTSGLMHGAFWPLAAQCVTHMTQAPFAGPGTATIRWMHDDADPIQTMLVLPDGNLVVARSNGLDRVDAASGDATVIDGGSYGYGLALVSGGRILAAKGLVVSSFDSTTFQTYWQLTIPDTTPGVSVYQILPFGPDGVVLVVTDGTILAAHRSDGSALWSGSVGTLTSSNISFAIDSVRMRLVTIDETGGGNSIALGNGAPHPFSSPDPPLGDLGVGVDGRLFFGSKSGARALGQLGTPLWVNTLLGGSVSTDATLDALGRPYFSASNGASIHLLDAMTGSSLWSAAVDGALSWGVVSDVNGVVYGQSASGTVYAFDSSKNPAVPLWKLPVAGPGKNLALAPQTLYVSSGTKIYSIGP